MQTVQLGFYGVSALQVSLTGRKRGWCLRGAQIFMENSVFHSAGVLRYNHTVAGSFIYGFVDS